jgi:hypothetical protein
MALLQGQDSILLLFLYGARLLGPGELETLILLLAYVLA